MVDPEIERWKNRGSISLWHYEGFPKNYCGYHLTADAEGCRFLSGLFERFREAKYPARKRILLDPPTPDQLKIPNCSRKCVPARWVEFRFRREFDKDHWQITENEGAVTIETGEAGLSELDRGVADIIRGEGDWSIGSEKNSLWFWS